MLRSMRAFRRKKLFDYILRRRILCISSDSLPGFVYLGGLPEILHTPGSPLRGLPSPAEVSGLQAVKRASIRLTLREDGS